MYNTLSCNKGQNAVDKICPLDYQLRIDSLNCCGLQKSQTFVFLDLRLAHYFFFSPTEVYWCDVVKLKIKKLLGLLYNEIQVFFYDLDFLQHRKMLGANSISRVVV